MDLSSCQGRSQRFLWSICLLMVCNNGLAAGTDRWTNILGGFWWAGTNWSSNVPPNTTFTSVFITNTGTKTVTIDAATPATNLSITALTLSAPATFTNVLRMADVPTNVPLHLSGSLTISRGGALNLTNSMLSFSAVADFNCLGGSATIE